MLKAAIEKILEINKPTLEVVEGRTFLVGSDGAREVRPALDKPDTLPLTSLDALVKLLRTEALDGGFAARPLYITIPNHLKVQCFVNPAPNLRYFRPFPYTVDATDVPGFLDGFREYGKAVIELRSRFAPGEGVNYLLDMLSRINKESSVTSADNGVSQVVEARQGVSMKAHVAVKPIVALRPYRTFQEVEQPESEFLLRLDGDGRVGLFEADGGMWKLKARQTVKEYFEEALADEIQEGSVVVTL